MIFNTRRQLFVFALLLFAASTTYGQTRGEELFNLCLSCHGSEGHGNKEIGAPAIAGLPSWYIEKQLETFASGVRGKHPDDDTGNRMRPMARTLNPEDIKIVAAYVSSRKPEVPEATIHGNLEKGKTFYP